MSESLNIKALTSESLAKLLSAAYRRNITVEYIDEIATEGKLFADDKTVNLLEFTAYLLKGDKNDS
ncbi:MAG: hypothetical protein Q4G59_07945 [Planctomycetia bacterium]|nr:hypothetical protein [Planctomycetia bacterium]